MVGHRKKERRAPGGPPPGSAPVFPLCKYFYILTTLFKTMKYYSKTERLGICYVSLAFQNFKQQGQRLLGSMLSWRAGFDKSNRTDWKASQLVFKVPYSAGDPVLTRKVVDNLGYIDTYVVYVPSCTVFTYTETIILYMNISTYSSYIHLLYKFSTHSHYKQTVSITNLSSKNLKNARPLI